MAVPSKREIRLDDKHSIKLRVSKWFPEMILLTVVLASGGTYYFGSHLSETTSINTSNFFKKSREKSSLVVQRKKMKSDLDQRRLAMSPRIVGAETRTKNFTVKIDSLVKQGDTATVVYQIHNKAGQPSSGSTWVSQEQNGSSKKKISWKARYFTLKEASVSLDPSGAGEFQIHVSDDIAQAQNTYTVRF